MNNKMLMQMNDNICDVLYSYISPHTVYTIYPYKWICGTYIAHLHGRKIHRKGLFLCIWAKNHCHWIEWHNNYKLFWESIAFRFFEIVGYRVASKWRWFRRYLPCQCTTYVNMYEIHTEYAATHAPRQILGLFPFVFFLLLSSRLLRIQIFLAFSRFENVFGSSHCDMVRICQWHWLRGQ